MKIKNQIITIIAWIFLFLIVFFITNYLIWKNNYSKLIYPQTKIGNLNLSGKSIPEAENLIKAQIKKIENPGLSFRYNTKLVIIPTTVASFDADLSYSLLNFNIKNTVLMAYGNKDQRTFKYYLLNNFKLISPRKIKALYTLNEERIKKLLSNSFPELNIPPINAYFSINSKNLTEFKLKNNPEKTGKKIAYIATLKELNDNLSKLKNNQIVIKIHSIYPDIKLNDLITLEPKVQKIINQGDLTLRLNSATTKYWEISPNQIITWISMRTIKNQPSIFLNQDKIKKYLKIHIAPSVNRVAIKPFFKITNDHISDWQNGKNGRQLDLKATAAQITKNFLKGQKQSDLIITEIPDENLRKNQALNIKQIIGTGQSNFRGSPKNRIHNIEVGATALQGILIKPGENFSLVKALGDITAKTGYLKELVIKGNKTIPEYGGGLCQIATTLFRTALAAGLPITKRENHSYRVSYYEPAGTDATIYDPQPDLRFTNNTKHYILIQARIIKNQLYFDFWGTNDGRIVSTTPPVIYNIVKPKPTKIIKTDTLKPGQKKCTESSHSGADAYFDYTVTYPTNSTTTPIHQRRFYSHYMPWQGVCLVGKSVTKKASSTSKTIPN